MDVEVLNIFTPVIDRGDDLRGQWDQRKRQGMIPYMFFPTSGKLTARTIDEDFNGYPSFDNQPGPVQLKLIAVDGTILNGPDDQPLADALAGGVEG